MEEVDCEIPYGKEFTRHKMICAGYPQVLISRGRQDHLFFDLKSNQSLDLFLLILEKDQSFKKLKIDFKSLILNHFKKLNRAF
jgi:hypothetical protein